MTKKIALTQSKVALVDDADYEWLNQWKWCYSTGYAVRGSGPRKRRKTISMHRVIMNAPDGMQVDHIDGDPLNNQHSNLRLATHAENQRNQRPKTGGSSQYKGVVLHRQSGKWQAQIELDNKQTYLGLFASEVDAAHAYDSAAIKYYGEFAWLNFQ